MHAKSGWHWFASCGLLLCAPSALAQGVSYRGPTEVLSTLADVSLPGGAAVSQHVLAVSRLGEVVAVARQSDYSISRLYLQRERAAPVLLLSTGDAVPGRASMRVASISAVALVGEPSAGGLVRIVITRRDALGFDAGSELLERSPLGWRSIIATGDAAPALVSGQVAIAGVFAISANADGSAALRLGLAGPGVNGLNNIAWYQLSAAGALAFVHRMGDALAEPFASDRQYLYGMSLVSAEGVGLLGSSSVVRGSRVVPVAQFAPVGGALRPVFDADASVVPLPTGRSISALGFMHVGASGTLQVGALTSSAERFSQRFEYLLSGPAGNLQIRLRRFQQLGGVAGTLGDVSALRVVTGAQAGFAAGDLVFAGTAENTSVGTRKILGYQRGFAAPEVALMTGVTQIEGRTVWDFERVFFSAQGEITALVVLDGVYGAQEIATWSALRGWTQLTDSGRPYGEGPLVLAASDGKIVASVPFFIDPPSAFNIPELYSLRLPGVCGDIDFNNDGVSPSDQDVVDYLRVLAGGTCSTGRCDSVDFNSDTIVPSDEDLAAFLRVLAGGPC